MLSYQKVRKLNLLALVPKLQAASLSCQLQVLDFRLSAAKRFENEVAPDL